MSCGVIGRDGAVDLQVQGGGHGGLLTADLRPRPERTDRRCQVNLVWLCFLFCFFLVSVSFFFFLRSLFIFVLSFYCLVLNSLFVCFFCVCWCIAWVMISFLYRCLQTAEKNGFGDCFQIYCLCQAQPTVCVCVCVSVCLSVSVISLWLRHQIWKGLHRFSDEQFCCSKRCFFC